MSKEPYNHVKTTGLVVFCIRYSLDFDEHFKLACQPEKIMVPLVPSAGLLLDKVTNVFFPLLMCSSSYQCVRACSSIK
jgi:hypothetical protein